MMRSDPMVLDCPECKSPAEDIGRQRFQCVGRQPHVFTIIQCPRCVFVAPVAADGLWICVGPDAHHGGPIS